ncbi:MAG: cytochrome c [Nitrospira sp.]|nr:cytochrome c [Nitrospira sp.]
MRTRSWVGIAMLLLSGMVPLNAALSGQASPEAGKKLYAASCQNCHGSTGKGDSEMGAYLTPPPADLTAKPTQTKTDAQLRKVILEGRSGTAMTGFSASLNEAQVDDLLAYIRSLQP